MIASTSASDLTGSKVEKVKDDLGHRKTNVVKKAVFRNNIYASGLNSDLSNTVIINQATIKELQRSRLVRPSTLYSSVMLQTHYIPWDSDAPSTFSIVRTKNYVEVAFIMLLLYDHVITLDKEVDWIWTLRWRLPKVLFIANRYVVTSFLVLDIVSDWIFPLSLSFCKFHLPLSLCIPVLTFSVVELLIIIRVYALYGHHKIIVWSLYCTLLFALVVETVTQVLYGKPLQSALSYYSLPGCFPESSRAATEWQWVVWATFLLVEVVLVLLTVYKLFAYRHELNRTITLLARDSIVYFIIIFACLVSAITSFFVERDLGGIMRHPSMCISCMAVGRMMMNIRGLIMSDPEHTLHLQTLQFATPTVSSIEEEVRGRHTRPLG